MANKPSSRDNRMRGDDGVNLTPMIDMITCLMFFLMMFASMLPVAIIDAPLPKIASTADEVKQAQDQKNKMEVVINIDSKGFQVKTDAGTERSFSVSQDGKYPYDELHKLLVSLKQKKPDTREVTLVPTDSTTYEVMINVMDASRELTKEDPGYQTVPPEIVRKPESNQFNRLFPEVSIGGV